MGRLDGSARRKEARSIIDVQWGAFHPKGRSGDATVFLDWLRPHAASEKDTLVPAGLREALTKKLETS
jgi:hypothetical protein